MTTPEAPGSLYQRCEELAGSVGLHGPRNFAVPWARVENSLGARLPSAYKVFIEYFGPGSFSEEFQYLIPGIENSSYELEFQVRNEFNSTASSSVLRLFPDPGGLLSFGTLPEDAVYWDTVESDPDNWSIVIPNPAYDDYLVRYTGDIIGFIEALLQEDPIVSCLQFAPDSMRVFAPDDGRHHGGRSPILETFSFFAS